MNKYLLTSTTPFDTLQEIIEAETPSDALKEFEQNEFALEESICLTIVRVDSKADKKAHSSFVFSPEFDKQDTDILSDKQKDEIMQDVKEMKNTFDILSEQTNTESGDLYDNLNDCIMRISAILGRV